MRRTLLTTWTAVVLTVGCTALPLPRDATYHGSDADLSVTRIAHGALLLDLKGTRILVDPWFHSSLWTRQTEPLGLTPSGLPDVAAVVLTHGHDAHFDPDALQELAKKVPRAIAPPPLADRLRELGFKDVTPLEWWDETQVGPVHVTAVPASHPVRENGYVIASAETRTYLAGDTRWFDGMVDIATAFPHPDVAFLPIGGERVMGWRRTMGPADAAKAAALIAPRRIVPIAYGAAGVFPFVWHTSDPVARFLDEVKDAGIDPQHVVVLAPGESWHYYR